MKKILNRILSFFSRLPVPIMILGVCILTYGLLIPWLGFYLDDWYIVLFQKYFGPENFSLFFINDRPLFAYVYDVFVPLFRDSKLGWQIFDLLAHVLAASCFWWVLIKIMPSRRKLATIAALFYAVYPGFQFSWFSVMYSQVFMLYAIYFLSYILMINAIKAKKRKALYWIGALLCLAIGIVPQETFIGLELIRPIVLWVVLTSLNPDVRQRIKKVLLNWAPYLLILIGFVTYRLANTKAFSYQATLFSELSLKPVQTIARLLTEIFWSAIDATLTTWVNLINILKHNLLFLSSIVMLILILFGIGLVFIFLKQKPDDGEQRHKNRWIILSSLLATVAAMTPFIAGSFKITLDFPNNRYLIALAPGASVFLAAVIDSLLHTNRQKILMVSILVGFAMGSQFMMARSLMLTWQAQNEFFWELSWRAPDIKPDTALVTDNFYFSDYLSSSSLTAPLNLIYANNNDSHHIPYMFILESQVQGIIPEYESNKLIHNAFRSFEFNGNTSSIILFTKLPNSCLRIITTNDSPQEFLYNDRYSFWHSAIPLSNLDRIIPNPDTPSIPDKKYFGSENRNQWCYYFEKADLARQQGQWEKTIQLYNEAELAGYKPMAETEWLPLVDAYLKSNQIDKAVETTKKVTNHDQTNTASFCQLWSEFKNNKNVLPFADEITSWLNCRD